MLLSNSSNNSSQSETPYDIWINRIGLITVNTLFALVGIFLNTLVVLSFWKSSQLRKKLCYILILVLASVDLVVVTVLHPLIIIVSVDRLIMERKYKLFPTVNDASVHLLCGFSLLTLVSMNIERYLAIVHPYLHQRLVTKPRLILFLCLLWFFGIVEWIVTFKKIIRDEYAVIFIAVIFGILLYINSRIFLIVRKKQLRDATQASSCSSINIAQRVGDTCPKPYKRVVHGYKMVWTCLFASMSFLVCFTPIVVYVALYTFQKDSFKEITFHYLRLWADTLLTMNSTFNCLIFFWKNKTLRFEGMKILKMLRSR